MLRRFIFLIIGVLLFGCGGSDGSDSKSDQGSATTITPSGDDGSQSEADASPLPDSQSPLEQALSSGHALLVADPNQFIQESRRYVAELAVEYDAIKAQLSGVSDGQSLDGLYWDPTHDAALLQAQFGFNTPILMTNKAMVSGYDDQKMTLGVAGEQSSARYAVLGSNPFRTSFMSPSSVNEPMHQWLDNLIGWLTQSTSGNKMRVVLAQLDQSYYFKDEQGTRAWLDARYPGQVSYNEQDACDGQALAACLSAEPDLLILSQHSTAGASAQVVTSAVKEAMARGIPVLYLHLNGHMDPLGEALFELLHVRYVGDNYWRKLGVDGWDATTLNGHLPEDIQAQQTLLARFESGDFGVDLSQCNDKTCAAASQMDGQFYQAVTSIQQQLMALDRQNIYLFASEDYRYEKLLLLLADHYRHHVRFPMDKLTSADADFLRAYFADYTQYYSRDVNPAQPDLGNVGRSTFPNVARITQEVTLNAKRNFRAAGVYAFPGETVVVTRLDDSPVATAVAFNTLRSGATHEFSDQGYKRPKFLTSPQFPLEPGQSIRLTSAYGGPLQVHFDDNDHSVRLRFENIGLHPVWRGSEDNQTFIDALNADQYDWAELITAGFEVHSTTNKMKESLNAVTWPTPADMAMATERYVSDLPHALAGFQGPGIDNISDIYDFGQAQGWQIDTIDMVKHMNADQANCGYGCSGNPYDAYWAFNPVGHGDLHELGHGLEKSRFRFEGWEGHASTNFYSYYSKSRFYQETGQDPDCQSLDFKALFELLQSSRNQPDPQTFMQQQNLTGWSWGARIYIQMMMSAQSQHVVSNGWHLLGRLHLLEREFNRLDNSVEVWNSGRASIGFAQYTLDEAKAMSRNDWLLVALSKVATRDMTAYLEMWGFAFSDKAKLQVSSNGYAAMPLQFFATSKTGYCTTEFATRPVNVDGITQWPL